MVLERILPHKTDNLIFCRLKPSTLEGHLVGQPENSLNLKPLTLNPQPQTLNPEFLNLHPELLTLNPEP